MQGGLEVARSEGGKSEGDNGTHEAANHAVVRHRKEWKFVLAEPSYCHGSNKRGGFSWLF